MIRSLYVLLLMLVTSAPAVADVTTGLEAFEQGDYATAFAEWQPLAKEGDPAAQYHLGILYRRGLGVAADNQQAIGWFERAGVRGHATAQYNLGFIYEQGVGVPADRAAALRWYRRAAKAEGSFKAARIRAQFRLADLLLEGNAVNRSAGMYWMQQSAEAGYAEAEFRLALAFASGKDLVQDAAAAARWFERAAVQGHSAAQLNLATMLEAGTGVPRDDAKAAHWYTSAAEQNAAVAQIHLGSLYVQGRGVAQDDRGALHWYLRAAQQGAPDAYFNLGVLYEQSSVLLDERESYFWYAVAAKEGLKKAGLRLAALREKIGESEAAVIERRAVDWRPDKNESVNTVAPAELDMQEKK